MSIPQEGGGPIEKAEELAAYLEAGCKPKERWRIGTEHEKFAFCIDSRRPLPYENGGRSIRAALEGLRDQHGWKPVMEGDNIIGLTKNGANVSLEPGGQVELSGAPLENIHQTCEETNQHLAELKSLAETNGVGFVGLGAAPDWSRADVPVMPKGRYGIMSAYMPKVGGHGLDMMFRTCTIQVNLDFSSEADMALKLKVAAALQPIATALFANSPFLDGKPTGWLSTRAMIWTDTDRDRTGAPELVFEDGFGFERWVQYALDTPMYFVYRNGRYVDASGQSFRDFLQGRLPALPGETPTMSDWADHLTTLFPDVRIKRFIEMRGADGGPWRRICALPALWVGLIYDQTALNAAWDLCKHWTAEQRAQLRIDAGRDALKAEIAGRTVRDIAADVLEIADAGLKARARAAGFDADESHFLNDLRRVVESGETAAEELLRRWRDEWDGDFGPIFKDYAY
ncbi:MAG: glutamate--cysteine ligase [Neomegalonema sp.]|nr:glutamate--cysteine ligase [Neomegalonema sp.]